MPLRCLFVDMNAFFASVEQQEEPSLRGRPVVVIPTDAATTSCIAASYEAKAFGIKTGTPVWEARRLGRGKVVFRIADHRRYLTAHRRILDAVGSVLPIDRVASIDEMSCRLVGAEQQPDLAVETALRVKAAIRDKAGESLKCSIGIGPNGVLAKTAADVQNPDGLTVFADSDLPEALYRLSLQDLPGIGSRMARRLNLHGVFSVRQLCHLPEKTLCDFWGSRVLGGRWHRILHGEEVHDTPTLRRMVGHSHVLPPALRTEEGAYGVMVRLAHKAAARMRKIGYWTGAVGIDVTFQAPWDDATPPDPAPRARLKRYRWAAGLRLPHCQDTPSILRAVANLWQQHPPGMPFKVGMMLTDLRPNRSATPSLFDDDRRADAVSHAMDEVNAEFGASVIHFGAMHGLKDVAPTRIAFTQIPDFDRRVN